MKNNTTGSKALLQRNYDHARQNLLAMLVLTLVNIVLLFIGSDTMFLFSATFPYMTVAIGQVFADTYPLVFVVCCVAATVSLLLYFLCWRCSKKHYGWMIAALVFFVLDVLTLVGFCLLLQDFSEIIDLLFHLWVLYYLIIGVKYGAKLKAMPEEVPAACDDPSLRPDTIYTDSTPLRRADTEVKARTLLEGKHEGLHICYRRVKSTNELVINGYVYAETKQLFELAHELSAVVDGHTITAGYDGQGHSYIAADGVLLARKRRII